MDEQASARNRAALSAALGAGLAGLGVAMGAFGTHSLRPRLAPRDLETFATGVQYLTLHGVAIVALAAAGAALGRNLRLPTALLAAGAVLFALSLTVLSVGGVRWMGAVAPLGGLGMISGWVVAARTLARREA